MTPKLRRDQDADLFADALEGLPPTAAAAELALLARELRGFGEAETPVAHNYAAGREHLLRLVQQQRDERRRVGIGRFKGAVLSIAAVSGAGLVVASAANGANPVTLAMDVVRDISVPDLHTPSAAREIAFEGEVVSANQRTIEVRSAGETIRVESPAARDGASRATVSPASEFETGTVVRVTGPEPADGRVAATKIEVLAPGAAKSGEAPSTVRPTVLATAAESPSATKEAPASAAVTPLISSASGLAATRTPAPKPSPTSTATAKPFATPTGTPWPVASVVATEPYLTPVAAVVDETPSETAPPPPTPSAIEKKLARTSADVTIAN